MKRFTLSVITIIAMSGYLSAESFPAEGYSSYSALYDNEEIQNAPYIGVSYTYMNDNESEDIGTGTNDEFDLYGDAITLLGGYKFNKYIAIEGRYSMTVGDLSLDATLQGNELGASGDGDMSNAAIYIKPMYTTSVVTAYGLLGYGQTKITIDDNEEFSENSLQWGLGVSFMGGKDISIFADYTRLYDDAYRSDIENISSDILIDQFNIGITHKFDNLGSN